MKVGREILRSLGLLEEGIELISCPTCGRTNIDLIRLVSKVEEELKHIKKTLESSDYGLSSKWPR